MHNMATYIDRMIEQLAKEKEAFAAKLEEKKAFVAKQEEKKKPRLVVKKKLIGRRFFTPRCNQCKRPLL